MAKQWSTANEGKINTKSEMRSYSGVWEPGEYVSNQNDDKRVNNACFGEREVICERQHKSTLLHSNSTGARNFINMSIHSHIFQMRALGTTS